MEKCQNGHKLEWSTVLYESDVFCCDICLFSRLPCASGRWNCMSCDFDICQNCKRKPFANTCLKNHSLEWSLAPYISGEYRCDICLRANKCQNRRWHCAQCEYDLCAQCKSPPEQSFYCPKNHQLKWGGQQGYSIFMCDLCNEYGEGPRHTCEICHWDICVLCKPLLKTQCPSGHNLTWSTVGTSSGYRCDFCSKSLSYNTGRWNCKECDYDICHVCRPKQKDVDNKLASEIEEIQNKIENIQVKDNVSSSNTIKSCSICFEDKESYAIIPCGHTSFCLECLSKLKVCPFCRKKIQGKLRLFEA